MKKICIVTATRAEYGILRPLIDRVSKDEECELQLIVTGAHIEEKFGNTIKEIEKDGYQIADIVDINIENDTDLGVLNTTARAMTKIGESLESLKPDIVIVLGDRYEIFGATSAAFILRIPVAHIAGGETTEGAMDEAFRHSITKMSVLHFPSTHEYRNRILQLGESPDTVFEYGYLGMEAIKKLTFLSKEELSAELNMNLDKPYFLLTFHPETLENSTVEEQLNNLFKALDYFPGYSQIWTKANADASGDRINELIERYVEKDAKNRKLFSSLGQLKYFSAMKYVHAVIGNSSSGIIEAPEFKVPTVNIGNRQKGRSRASSIIDSGNEVNEIKFALEKALSEEFVEICKKTNNPYSGDNVSEKILFEIKRQLEKGINLKKSFYNIQVE